MQAKFKNLLLAATAMFAFSVPSFGQSMLTFETITSPESGTTTFQSINPLTTGKALIQTFSSASHLQSLTYRFITPTTGSANFNAYFTQWNPLNNRAVTGASVLAQSFTVTGVTNPVTTAGDVIRNIVDFQLILNATLNSELTYAMILLAQPAAASPAGFALLNITDNDPFEYGSAFTRTGINNTSQAASFAGLTTTTASALGGDFGGDYGFSAISITIVPEPSTAAAALVVGFIGIMVLRRRLQRNKVQPVTIA